MKRLLSPILETLPDWITDPFSKSSFVFLAYVSAHLSAVAALFIPWLNILTMMLFGWLITCALAVYEQRLRKDSDKDWSELFNKWIFYTLLVASVAFLFVLEKMLDAVSGVIVGSGVVLFFGVMFWGEVKKIRANWKAKYKPLADLSWLDRVFDRIEKQWIQKACNIEPIEEEEDENKID